MDWVGGLLIASTALAERRFGRNVINLADPKGYILFRLDDVHYAAMEKNHVAVSSLVYKGTEHYYVEVGVFNRSEKEISIPVDFISFNKPNYSVVRTNTLATAAEVTSDAGGQFVPTPAPQVRPSSTTTYNGTATTYGNQTAISGTATTTPDYSAQAGANIGNALGNALAARSFYKAQSEAMKFAQFLATFAQTGPVVLKPGEAHIIVCAFTEIATPHSLWAG